MKEMMTHKRIFQGRKTVSTLLSVALLPVFLTALFPLCGHGQTYRNGIRIGWEYANRKFATGGTYARVKKLQNGNLALVYSSGSAVWISQKKTTSQSWGSAVRVADDGQGRYNYTNAELIELHDGTLMYAWNARPRTEGNAANPYKIMACYSHDGGQTWVDVQDIYAGGSVGNDGCWEPAMLQLPSGELQIYFANEHQVANNNQNITMKRSFDDGKTWGAAEVVSFRSGTRDGMPVPLLLQNKTNIVVAIEDNGLNGAFKPAIVATSLADNWSSGTVSGTSTKRWSALQASDMLAAGIYAGAPYLIQLSTGETLLSVQSGEGREQPNTEHHALMQVYVGSNAARNFVCKSTPFTYPNNADARVLWNSLCQVDDSTVMAVSSITGLSENNGIWTNTGRIMRPLKPKRHTGGEKPWAKETKSLFIGAESQANATIKSMWDNDSLYFHFDVFDRKQSIGEEGSQPWETDGIEIYLDPQQKGSSGLVSGLYKFLVNIAGTTLCSYTDGTTWKDTAAPNMKHHVTKVSAIRYTIDVAIPWADLGGMSARKSFNAMFKLHNIDIYKNSTTVCHENLSGSNPDQPRTWMQFTLDETTGIKTINNSQLTIHNDCAVYDLQGRKVIASPSPSIRRGATSASSTSPLPPSGGDRGGLGGGYLKPGIYIVGGKKIKVE